MTRPTPAYLKRWRYDRDLGRPRLVDASPVREHLQLLVDAGLTRAAIARTAGVSHHTVSGILAGTYATTQRSIHDRLIRVTAPGVLARQADAELVPLTGSLRRIHALLAIGWRYDDINAVTPGAVNARATAQGRDQYVTRATHDAICAAYDALSMRPGPSERTRNRAKACGYAPPLAWDDDLIDDPTARPEGAGYRPAPVIESIRELEQAGMNREAIAQRLGVTRDAIDAAISRATRKAAA